MKRPSLPTVVLTATIVLLSVAPTAEARRSVPLERAPAPTTASGSRTAESQTSTASGTTPTTTATWTTPTTRPKRKKPPTSSTTPATPPLPVDAPRLTKLRFTIDSTSDWAMVDLRGGEIYEQGTPTVTGGTGSSYSKTGFAVQTAGTMRFVVDVVYELPASGSLDVVICKNNDGVTSVRIDRLAGTKKTVATFSSSRSDGVWQGQCANPAQTSVAASAAAPDVVWPQPVDPRRLTLAIYSPWYDDQTFERSTFVDEPLKPYDVSDQASVNAMVAKAADNGINGFLYWYNGMPEAAQRYEMVIDAAEARSGFSVTGELDIGVLADRNGGVTSSVVASWTRTLLAQRSSPSYLHVHERPVLFVWGTQWLNPSVWAAARSGLASEGLDPFVVGDSLNPAYGFDGYWVLSSNTESDTSSLPRWYEWWAREARVTPARSLGSDPILWAAGISPGEDDTYSGKLFGWLQIPRENGERYDRVWQAAAGSTPDWMVISSWNDFHEATYVMPSEKLGTKALDQTRAWTRWYFAPR